MDLDNHSVIIDIPRPRMCAKKGGDCIRKFQPSILKQTKEMNREKPSDISAKKYLIDDKPMPVSILEKEENVLPCRMYLKKQDSRKFKQKLSLTIKEKYKIKKTDLQKRLYIERLSNDVYAMTDIDEGFFNYVNGRMIRDRVPLFKSLKSIVNDLMRIKQEIGYRHDTVLQIDTNHEKELDKYKITSLRCIEQAKCFDEFISGDYRKSMKFLDKWDEIKIKLEEKMSELHNLANEQFTIMSRLIGLDYMYSIQQKYGRFLYYLSPPSWRSKNREFAHSIEIEAKGFDLGQSNEEDTFKVIFEKMQKECSGNLIKPVLYFTHPLDLITIFEGIEKQHLHHFSYVTHLAPPKKMMKEGIKTLKEIITQETASVISTIQGFENLLQFTEERCTQLKNRFFSILNGMFYESVGAPEVLKLSVHLEFCYERVYAEKPINMDIVSTARALENFYMDFSKQLDEVHNDNVKRAISECVQKERTKLKKARNASRELRLFDRLERELKRAHNPVGEKFSNTTLSGTKQNSGITLTKQRSYKHPVNIDQRERLDESEMEYLTLFTDWIEGEDPSAYIHLHEEEERV